MRPWNRSVEHLCRCFGINFAKAFNLLTHEPQLRLHEFGMNWHCLQEILCSAQFVQVVASHSYVLLGAVLCFAT